MRQMRSGDETSTSLKTLQSGGCVVNVLLLLGYNSLKSKCLAKKFNSVCQIIYHEISCPDTFGINLVKWFCKWVQPYLTMMPNQCWKLII